MDSPRVGDLPRRGPRVQSRIAQAARADPLLRAEPAEGQEDQDRLLDRRVRARGAEAGAPDDRQAARLAPLLEAPLHLHRGSAAARVRARRPAPHHASTRPSPPPAASPRPTRTSRTSRSARTWGAASAARSWPARPRPDAARRGLLADRAAHHRPRLRRRASARRIRPRRRHPPRDRRPRAAQGPRGRHPRRALDGQDGQLRSGVRDERLRAVVAGRASRAPRPRRSSTTTSPPTAASATT